MASRICWSCGVKAHQKMTVNPSPTKDGYHLMASYSCDECGVLSIGYMRNPKSSLLEVRDIIELMDGKPVEWLPVDAVGRSYPEVPEQIAAAASEAHACHSIGTYRAAAIMARAVIEATAKDKGFANGTLKSKIDNMAKSGIIRDLVRDQAHEVRHLGNDMAHGDFVEAVVEEESAEVLELMAEVLDEVYQAPAKLQARKRAREAKTQGVGGASGAP